MIVRRRQARELVDDLAPCRYRGFFLFLAKLQQPKFPVGRRWLDSVVINFVTQEIVYACNR